MEQPKLADELLLCSSFWPSGNLYNKGHECRWCKLLPIAWAIASGQTRICPRSLSRSRPILTCSSWDRMQMTRWVNRLVGCYMCRISTSRHIRMWTNLDQINVVIYSVIDRSNLGYVVSVSNLWEGILTTRWRSVRVREAILQVWWLYTSVTSPNLVTFNC